MDYSLSELCIAACAECLRGDGEILASGIGVVPRIAVGLAKLTFEPGLLMTEGEAYLISKPIPLGPRTSEPLPIEGLMTYERVFDIVYSGKRHAIVGPVQVDRWGQMNISAIGDYHKPKVSLLGVRGFPGNTICHKNSMFVPKHSTRAFVEGEVDMVGGVGYNKDRWPDGKKPEFLDLRRIITDLCVMDFGGADHAIRVISLHPGVGLDEVRDKTGFPLEVIDGLSETPAPTAAQLKLIREVLDPHDLRASVFPENPPGRREAS